MRGASAEFVNARFRIYTRLGELVMETSACDQTSFHELSRNRSVFIACGIEHRIEQGRSAGSTYPSPASTKRYWHNGSIVAASFDSDGVIKILYVDLKDSLPFYMHGLMLFDGQVDRSGRLSGTAYNARRAALPRPIRSTASFARPTSRWLARRQRVARIPAW
jgi:hypothetical protein